MYAVIITGGKQYKVQKGEKLKVELLDFEKSSDLEFDKILLFSDGKKVKIGAPYVKDITVKAKVIKHGRHKKINILKFKRRKNHIKHLGHRQYFTEIEILDIQVKSKKAEAAA